MPQTLQTNGRYVKIATLHEAMPIILSTISVSVEHGFEVYYLWEVLKIRSNSYFIFK